MLIRIPKLGAIIKPFSRKTKKRKSVWLIEEIENISQHYDLGTISAKKVFSGGNSNNLLIQTSKGKMVLKKYIWDLQSTIYEHSILEHLEKFNYPAPKLVRNKESEAHTKIGNKHYAIYEHISGDCPDNYYLTLKDRMKLAKQAGELLGTLHSATVNFVPIGEKLNGFRPNGKDLYRNINWHVDTLDRYVETVQSNALITERDQFLISILNKVKGDMSDVGQNYENPDKSLQKLIIHGDYSPHNLLIDRSGIKAILDFEGACLNLRIEDISYGLTTFCWMKNGGIVKKLSKEFISGYQMTNHISGAEIESIPDILRWIYLRKIVRPIVHMIESKLNKKVRGDELSAFKFKFGRACWYENNREKILEIFE